MSKETVNRAEGRQSFSGGPLPLFDQIAQGFLENLANDRQAGEPLASLNYLDGKVKIDGASCTRRDIVLAIEDFKQQIEAPLPLRSDAYAEMKLLKLDPVPEMKLYRDVATAILRIDAALHFNRIIKDKALPSWQSIYH
jgi:hypothetical protein